MKLAGGCQCGRVRYVANEKPFHETICYCVDCRRSSGAVGVAWFSVKRTTFQWTGTPAAFRSSQSVLRRFCDRCGTTLAYEDGTLPEEIDLTIGSLDDPAMIAPKDYVWTQQKPEWITLSGALPHFGRRRR